MCHIFMLLFQYIILNIISLKKGIKILPNFIYMDNPFLIDIPDSAEYTMEDYINIQEQLDGKRKSIDTILHYLWPAKNYFYEFDDFKARISRGITQRLVDISNNIMPTKTLYKIGDGGNGRNCIVCATAISNTIRGGNTRFLASQRIMESLEKVGFNGHFYLFNGGFPNPTGVEMKYSGVPYCFKIFMMLEAQLKGFDKVIWVDSGCYAINNPQDLFDILYEKATVIKTIKYGNNYDAMSFPETIQLLNNITGADIHSAEYIESVVFGLNMESKEIRDFIGEYYEMVKLGYPFFSIFPEEIVFTALFNKPEFKKLLHDDPRLQKTRIHEKEMGESDAKKAGYYFHHRDYKRQV